MAGIERDAADAKAWAEAQARGEVRPLTMADLIAATARREARKARKATRAAAVRQVAPYVFIVKGKP
jgi:hypothetical protein